MTSLLCVLGLLAAGCAIDGPIDERLAEQEEAVSDARSDVRPDRTADAVVEAVGGIVTPGEEEARLSFEGDPCDGHDVCVDGFCDTGTCASWFELGDACGGYGSVDDACDAGRVCVYMVTRIPDHPGHCALGCAEDADCGDGMHCATRPEGDVCLPD